MTAHQETFRLAVGPPPLMWAEYEKVIRSDWKGLLSSERQNEERPFQAFLERHPCMVPGAFGPTGVSGNYPFWGAVIAQPVLPDFNYKKPDFMWLASDSAGIYPMLVEIKAPVKRWFTKTGRQTAQLTAAIQQLTEWRTWFGDPVNVQKFLSYYGFPLLDKQMLRPFYLLIYGRREEATRENKLAKLRGNMQRQHEILMTYGRLCPQPLAEELWTIRGRPGEWEAVSIPPTTQLGPALAEARAHIHNRAGAIRSNPLMPQARADFLVERLAYWDRWASGHGRRIAPSAGEWAGDWE